MFHPSTFADLAERPGGRRRRAATEDAPLLIRRAAATDEPENARLSALDELERPAGVRLIAGLGGRIVAALDVRSGRAVADPFVPTSGILALLGLRAAQVRR